MSKALKDLIGYAAVISMFWIGTAEFVATVDAAESARRIENDGRENQGIDEDELRKSDYILECFGVNDEGKSFVYEGEFQTWGDTDFFAELSWIVSHRPANKIIQEFERYLGRWEFKKIDENNERSKVREQANRIIFLDSVKKMKPYLKNSLRHLDTTKTTEYLRSKLIEESGAIIFPGEHDIVNDDAVELNKKREQYFEAIKILLKLLIDEGEETIEKERRHGWR